jgi:hypothetical protein
VHDSTLVLDSSEGVLALTLAKTDGNGMALRNLVWYLDPIVDLPSRCC